MCGLPMRPAAEASCAEGERGLREKAWTEAEAAYRKALAEEPYREDLHRDLMIALVGAGRPAEAVQQHQALVELLRRELNTGPTDETEHFFRSIQSRPHASP